ncbi:N-acyl-L-homoserine lactone synthetase [Roseovarius azorensis]|uniref:Acyl-homoserine-lactone synthase n=1 Tax=Roseovarius azorensis TaxID=1287727 RepID=A0A1H7TS09_9RHOB|nr:acyl-homoserine-lactone synthase [Roseovarius azorensis]SEL87206.1 N-acyl-L-homoserine lactone synthetase [Roseovarius azorensis]
MKHAWTLFGSMTAPSTSQVRDGEPSDRPPIVKMPRRIREAVRQDSRQAVDETANILTADMSFQNMNNFGNLFPKYLKARKSVFIDRLNWHVSETEGMEFDQYDTPFCRWVVLVEFGDIIGGVRLMPTTAACGIYSYMLRDAHLGLLEDFPTDVLFIEPPVDIEAWEASRFFIKDSIPGTRRLLIQSRLFSEMNRVAEENGAKYILGIVPAVWARWARRLNVTATPIGAPFSIEGSRSQSVLFRVEPPDRCARTP